jgi:hypothetical protein
MAGKLLFVITSGPEEVNKVSWGLRMALNVHTHPYGEKLIDEVRVLLFCGGVQIVDPDTPHYEELSKRLKDLTEAGVEVASCMSIAIPLGLKEETESLGIECLHASVYVAQCVSEGFTTITF